MKHYITFGQVHTHRVNGQTFDCNCVAVLEAPNANIARDLAFELFGAQWHNHYTDDNVPADLLNHFPRGEIYVDRKPHIEPPYIGEPGNAYDTLMAACEYTIDHLITNTQANRNISK